MTALTASVVRLDLVAELRRLADTYEQADDLDDVTTLTDELTSVLRRTRGRLARLAKKDKPAAPAPERDAGRENIPADIPRSEPKPEPARGRVAETVRNPITNTREYDRHETPQVREGREGAASPPGGPPAGRKPESPRPHQVPGLPPAREPAAAADQRPPVPAPHPTPHPAARKTVTAAAAALAAVLMVLVTLWTPVASVASRWIRRVGGAARRGWHATRDRVRRFARRGRAGNPT